MNRKLPNHALQAVDECGAFIDRAPGSGAKPKRSVGLIDEIAQLKIRKITHCRIQRAACLFPMTNKSI
jgi:hypothetical protein